MKSFNINTNHMDQSYQVGSNKRNENSHRLINNYETVEYVAPKQEPPSRHDKMKSIYNENEANSADVYYQENNDIYVEDDTVNTMMSSKSKSSPQYLEIIQTTPQQQPQENFVFPLPPPPPTSDTHYLEATYPGPAKYQQQTRQNFSNTLSYRPPHEQNNYSSNSMINVKYVIDINDLKTHLNTQTMQSQHTIKTNLSHLSEKSQVIKEEPHKGEGAQENKDSPKIVVKCGCIRIFISFMHFLCGIFSCFTNCLADFCCKPCCSTAAMLGGVGAIGGAVAGAAALGVLGVIPIPVEFTRNICKFDPNHNLYNNTNFVTNLTNTVVSSDDSKDLIVFNITGNNFNQTITTTTKVQEFMVRTDLEKIAIQRVQNIKAKLNHLKRQKKQVQLVRPLEYQVTLYPKYPGMKKKFDAAHNLEMKISMKIRFECMNKTNLIQLATREFSTIDISFSSHNKMTVKKWSYDSITNLLTIETAKLFSIRQTYDLSIFIHYKNYGNVYNQKRLRQIDSFYFLSFNNGNQGPFPAMVETFENGYISFPGPSVFNVTIAKPAKIQSRLIFNMGILNISNSNGLDYIQYKPTPYLPIQTISLILGHMVCKENPEDFAPIKLQLCNTFENKNLDDNFDLIISYTRSLLSFYKDYTNVNYTLNKIDIVVLPMETPLDFLNNDQVTAQLGIIYLPQTYVENIRLTDQLEQAQALLKVIHLISKQLAKHWFYNYQDCHSNLPQNAFADSDLATETYHFMKNFCDDDRCSRSRDVKMFLRYNQNCYLFKGVIGWISYLGFESVYPDLFDLIQMEWSLIRELDESYFFSDSNVKYIYKIYDFPRLTESNNIQRIKTEIKGILAARSISLLLGKDKFKNLIVDWFITLNKSLESKGQIDTSVLSLVQKYSSNYNMVSYFNRVKFGQVLNSWILAPDDIVLNFQRNYNKKSAEIQMELTNLNNSKSVYYPLNWKGGNLITNENKQEILLRRKKVDVKSEKFNVIWLNQSIASLTKLPGADKWIIGNYKKMFGPFRINYDEQNWNMLIKNLVLDYKSFEVNERVQIIDDVFYLANNQRISITTALNVVQYIPNEDKFLPWKFLVNNIKRVIGYIEEDSLIYSNLRDYLIHLIKPTYHKLKWGESLYETIDEKLIRILVVDLLCSLDYEDCVENSVKQLVDSIKINVYNIPLHLSKSIYCTAIRYTGINEWLYLWKYYTEQAETSPMKDSLLYSLSCSSHIWILNLFLRKLVYENSIPIDELPIVFEYISQNPVGKYITWNHISQDHQTFYNKIGNDPELFLKILQVSTKELKFKYEIKQFYDFVNEIGTENITFNYSENNKNKLLLNIASRINKYAAWKNKNANDLNRWLIKENKKV